MENVYDQPTDRWEKIGRADVARYAVGSLANLPRFVPGFRLSRTSLVVDVVVPMGPSNHVPLLCPQVSSHKWSKQSQYGCVCLGLF